MFNMLTWNIYLSCYKSTGWLHSCPDCPAALQKDDFLYCPAASRPLLCTDDLVEAELCVGDSPPNQLLPLANPILPVLMKDTQTYNMTWLFKVIGWARCVFFFAALAGLNPVH